MSSVLQQPILTKLKNLFFAGEEQTYTGIKDIQKTRQDLKKAMARKDYLPGLIQQVVASVKIGLDSLLYTEVIVKESEFPTLAYYTLGNMHELSKVDNYNKALGRIENVGLWRDIEQAVSEIVFVDEMVDEDNLDLLNEALAEIEGVQAEVKLGESDVFDWIGVINRPSYDGGCLIIHNDPNFRGKQVTTYFPFDMNGGVEIF